MAVKIKDTAQKGSSSSMTHFKTQGLNNGPEQPVSVESSEPNNVDAGVHIGRQADRCRFQKKSRRG